MLPERCSLKYNVAIARMAIVLTNSRASAVRHGRDDPGNEAGTRPHVWARSSNDRGGARVARKRARHNSPSLRNGTGEESRCEIVPGLDEITHALSRKHRGQGTA